MNRLSTITVVVLVLSGLTWLIMTGNRDSGPRPEVAQEGTPVIGTSMLDDTPAPDELFSGPAEDTPYFVYGMNDPTQDDGSQLFGSFNKLGVPFEIAAEFPNFDLEFAPIVTDLEERELYAIDVAGIENIESLLWYLEISMTKQLPDGKLFAVTAEVGADLPFIAGDSETGNNVTESIPEGTITRHAMGVLYEIWKQDANGLSLLLRTDRPADFNTEWYRED